MYFNQPNLQSLPAFSDTRKRPNLLSLPISIRFLWHQKQLLLKHSDSVTVNNKMLLTKVCSSQHATWMFHFIKFCIDLIKSAMYKRKKLMLKKQNTGYPIKSVNYWCKQYMCVITNLLIAKTSELAQINNPEKPPCH